MANKNYELLKQANAAISGKNHEAFISFCADDIVWNMVGDEAIHGKVALKNWLDKTYLKPPQFNIEQSIEEGDLLAVRGKIAIEDKQGNITHSKYCDVWRFKNGLLAELNAYAIETD